MEGLGRSGRPSRVSRQKAQKAKAQRREMRQVSSKRALKTSQESGFNQALIKKKFKTLEEQRSRRKALSKAQAADDEIEIVEEVARAEEAAKKFNKRNFELKERTLLLLKDSLNEDDSVEDILKKVLEFYPDYTLADEALDFLLETSRDKLYKKVATAKEYLNTHYQREIVAGRNINLQAQIFSKEGMGTPTFLRDMYRSITGDPRTPNALFEELSSQFSYESLKVVIRFLLHSLGSDLKAKGPSISRPELIRLMQDAQMLQSIIGVYRFFKSREGLVASQFDHFGLTLPPILNFEVISKQFMALLKERYISSEKVLQLSRLLGISEELAAQIIIYTQMRDAIRQTSYRLYKSQKHREDVLNSFLEALEELEEELEEEEEEE